MELYFNTKEGELFLEYFNTLPKGKMDSPNKMAFKVKLGNANIYRYMQELKSRKLVQINKLKNGRYEFIKL